MDAESGLMRWYQRFWLNFLAVVAAVIVLGQVLKAFNEARAFATPTVTYIGTVIVVSIWLLAEIMLRFGRVRWVGSQGQPVIIRRWGGAVRGWLLAILVLLWIPRVYSWVSEPTASLDVSAEVVASSQEPHVMFFVNNMGDKSAREIRYRLWVPAVIVGQGNILVSSKVPDLVATLTVNGRTIFQYEETIESPIHPTTTKVRFAALPLKADAPAGEYVLEWWLSTDDGTFPRSADGTKRGEIRIEVPVRK